MGASTLDKCLSDFLQRRSMKRFSAGVQSVYFDLVLEFWLRDFPETITLPVRDIADTAGLSVGQTHTAKNILKNNGLIDFRNERGRTVFSLGKTEQGTEHELNTDRTQTEQRGFVCYTPAQAQSGDDGATLPLPPAPPNPIPKEPKAMQASKQASKQASPAEDVVELWERTTGKKLEDGERAALRTFDEVYGREIVKVAIVTYAYKKGRTFGFFDEYCLQPLIARLRGGEEDGRGVRVDRRAGGSGRYAQSFTQTAGGREDGEIPDETDYEGLAAAIAAIQKPKSND